MIFLVSLISMPASAIAIIAQYTITANGGDCADIGEWQPSTSTCTLSDGFDFTTPSAAAIEIGDDNITLDGNYKTLTGSGSGANIGIYINGRSGVTVRNLNTDQFGYGIYLDGSSGNTLTGNTASGALLQAFSLNSSNDNEIAGNSLLANMGDAVRLESSAGNNLTGNTFANNGGYGVVVSVSDDNTFYGNDISNNSLDGVRVKTSSHTELTNNSINGQSAAAGVYIFQSGNSTVVGNTFAANGTGMRLEDSSNNDIHNNNFTANATQALATGGGGNAFDTAAPFGGNYWDGYDSPVEGCNNTNGDGFCDSPYSFTGGRDDLPWATYDGWVDTVPPTISSVFPGCTVYSGSTTISVDYTDDGLGVDTAR